MHEIENDLAELTEAIWSTTLKLDAERVSADAASSDCARLVAQVGIRGPSGTAIVLDCPEELVRLAAAVLFSLAPVDATEEDMQDAIGELVNVIAGNARGLFAGNTGINLPIVDRCEGEYLPPGRITDEVSLLCQDIRFRVFVLEEARDA